MYAIPSRAPRPMPPALGCDCHFHAFGDAVRFPLANPSILKPPIADFEAARTMRAALGLGRGVLVQPMGYGTDHRYLIECLRSGQAAYRGVAIVNDAVSDAELHELHEAGVRGARLNLSSAYPAASRIPAGEAEFERTAARIQKLGWHAKILVGDSDDLVRHQALLERLTLPVVVDHLGGVDPRRGLNQPGFQLLLKWLRQSHWWILLANGDRRSVAGFPWDDIVPFGQALAAAAPDRALWASNWPPGLSGKAAYPDDVDLLELLNRFVPDEAARRKVLADNPSALYFS